MKLLNSIGPNPRMVRMFMHEKGIEIPLEDYDLLGGENRSEAFLKKNPGGQIPALQLDNGEILAETVAICEYLEEKHPSPALIGSTAEERAEARMWQRRVELNIAEHLYAGFRYAEGLDMFRDRVYCIPDAAPEIKKKAQSGLQWLDGLMQNNKFLCGDRITVGDVLLYCCVDFVASVGQPLDPALKNVNRWFEAMNARESAQATLAPNWKELGMRV